MLLHPSPLYMRFFLVLQGVNLQHSGYLEIATALIQDKGHQATHLIIRTH
jgi:hypothetical protein